MDDVFACGNGRHGAGKSYVLISIAERQFWWPLKKGLERLQKCMETS